MIVEYIDSNSIYEDKHTDETYGCYTILGWNGDRDKYGKKLYVGICNHCGKYAIMRLKSFERLDSSKCYHIRLNGGDGTKYWDNQRISRIYRKMVERCYKQSNKAYVFYGGKGIKICDEWIENPKSFEEWSLSNGYEEWLTIDRKDSSKDYSPENCRWVELLNNSKYKSTTKYLYINNEMDSCRGWSKKCGLGTNAISKYLREYPEDKVKELIVKRMSNPNLERKSHQTWFDVYGIQV